jgi:hypothetical protein
MKLGEAAADLVKLADENSTMTFCFDESYGGLVRVEWKCCLAMEIPARDLPRAVEYMKKLEALGMETC